MPVLILLTTPVHILLQEKYEALESWHAQLAKTEAPQGHAPHPRQADKGGREGERGRAPLEVELYVALTRRPPNSPTPEAAAALLLALHQPRPCVFTLQPG